MACREQKIWGYETRWGSLAQFTKVQAQQLLRKPKNLDWLSAASYGLTYFTAYRMLVHQAELTAGDNVLAWGPSGGRAVRYRHTFKHPAPHPPPPARCPDPP